MLLLHRKFVCELIRPDSRTTICCTTNVGSTVVELTSRASAIAASSLIWGNDSWGAANQSGPRATPHHTGIHIPVTTGDCTSVSDTTTNAIDDRFAAVDSGMSRMNSQHAQLRTPCHRMRRNYQHDSDSSSTSARRNLPTAPFQDPPARCNHDGNMILIFARSGPTTQCLMGTRHLYANSYLRTRLADKIPEPPHCSLPACFTTPGMRLGTLIMHIPVENSNTM